MKNPVRLVMNLLHRGGRGCALLLAAAVACAGTVRPADAQVTQTVLHIFQGDKDGAFPYGTLLADTTGPGGALRALYGTTSGGRPSNLGIAFKLAPPGDGQTAWTESELWRFTGGTDAGALWSGLFSPTAKISPLTTLYGTTNEANGTVFRLTGRTVTTIWTFTGGSDGSHPYTNGIIAGKGGALYGTTQDGALDPGIGGCGAVYRLTPPGADQKAWTETTLHEFRYPGRDGCSPHGLIADASGALYGTALAGPSPNSYCLFGCGTVFKLTPPAQGKMAWTEQTLYTFLGGGDGAYPVGALAAGKKGVLYGTTSAGGAVPCAVPGLGLPRCGTVFELTPPGEGQTGWTKQIVWSFTGGGDGAYFDGQQRSGALLIDSSGALYGTTSVGGSSSDNCAYGSCGTVFKLTPPEGGQTAWTETTLWAFTGGSDGGTSFGGLVADNSGALYGTTASGGDLSCDYGYGCGVVFRLTGTGYVP